MNRFLMLRRACVYAASILAICGLRAACAGEPVTWTFNESTSGADVHWVSPTSVDPNAQVYDSSYELTGVFVTVPILGEVDVTSLVPKEQRMGSGSVPGPAPVLLFDQMVVYPLPPEDPSISAHLTISLDAQGFGRFDATEVFLGTINIGGFELQIQSVRVVGEVTVNALGFVNPADLDGDGDVDFDDFTTLLANWGPCDAGPTCPGDIDGDGDVDFDDFTALLANWS